MEQKKKKNAVNSILFRSWISFIVLALGIIIAVWLGEIVVFSTLFSEMRTEMINDTNADLVERLRNNGASPDSPAFRQAVDRAVTDTRMSIVIFTFEENGDELDPDDVKVLYYRNHAMVHSGGGSVSSARSLVTEEFLARMSFTASNGSFSYNNGDNPTFNVIYGAKTTDLAGGTVYYFSTTLVSSNDGTVGVLATQFQAVTVVSLLVAVLVSLFIAWKFSKPIRDFTATAKRIGDGDLTLKYVGNGYNEFDDLADALNYSTEEIIRAENLRRDFLANVSHDLRTPLTLVKAYAEMIRDISGDNKEKRIKNTQIIINEVDRLTMLVDDILDLSKLESGTAEIHVEPLNMSETVRSSLAQFAVMSEKGYKIESDIEDGLFIEGDYKRVTQIIYNLVGNAINYAGEDMLVLVKLIKKEDGKMRMEVSDHGKGIAQNEIDSVWDRYYRTNQKKRNVVGSGLGLSIVKNIFLSLGADYGIISKEGEGTTFWFELPTIPDPDK